MGNRFRLTALCFTAVWLMVLTAGPSRAHYLESNWYTVRTINPNHYDWTFCLGHLVHLSHSSTAKGGFFRSGAQSTHQSLHPQWPEHCSQTFGKFYTTHAHLQAPLRYSASRDQWEICNGTPDWVYKSNDWRTFLDRSSHPLTWCGGSSYSLNTVTQAWDPYEADWYGAHVMYLWEHSPNQWYHQLPVP